ncbi:MAG: preprotein translocase subunit SecE [Zetaproteobacteria bacterium CG12_big_fil_rev_8_21_14_0_65_54_13]|nr:MAG: preprotein translocase subunit SecE [Zetaproteobacteria bacterium CG23_combo_of_CG06-09_8_20_14_all_54_7]PIW44255.1 MAG: preprotein translocase subunit SecE [Zetaproteobacteria bacterium CG12_big_fil_rev_8_21_14_0_65_54_13]PIX53936.1 MAG: preprotein translocase subunit SecE [Zetaproteobacteria bacterium CG_4_10_14_3_um_filter_54_28]PJA30620.1 MAG: preprotein translocase subunit SecE [Zetaproteobacteria bacterium CG_4_9_14_3_um_filter_54_145]
MSRVAEMRKFMSEVKVEAKKVTWPERRETLQSTLMVFVMVIFIALFLWLVDSALSWLVQQVI